MIKKIYPYTSCIICGDSHLEYEFMVENHPLVRCQNCNFLFLNPPPPQRDTDDVLSPVAFVPDRKFDDDQLYRSAKTNLERLQKYKVNTGSRILELGEHDSIFKRTAEKMGFDLTSFITTRNTVENKNNLSNEPAAPDQNRNDRDSLVESYDAFVLRVSLHFYHDPIQTLLKIRSLLKPGGILFLTEQPLVSMSSKTMRNNSFDFISSFLNYFDFHTIRVALLKSGFANIHIESVDPRRKADHKNSGYVRVLCRAVDIRKPPLLSVIVPVYNEKPTFSIMMDQLLKKDIKGLEKEIIIVESNSSDGTKDDVDRYKNIPGVTVIYEDKPRGKGHAVRTGFKHAKGDYFIIQDGDLEYDINDYELLLEPLISGKAVFVLGSRHGESWKIRKYKKIFLPYIMNLAHWALVGIMNIFYRQSMSDPFTMYKVFHRDCLYGLQFECDRFNFDIELVCKLLRKGYTPYEVTVNYKSRHFSEGKKVKFFRDPPTWIKAIIKYRIVQVYFPFMNPKGKEV